MPKRRMKDSQRKAMFAKMGNKVLKTPIHKGTTSSPFGWVRNADSREILSRIDYDKKYLSGDWHNNNINLMNLRYEGVLTEDEVLVALERQRETKREVVAGIKTMEMEIKQRQVKSKGVTRL